MAFRADLQGFAKHKYTPRLVAKTVQASHASQKLMPATQGVAGIQGILFLEGWGFRYSSVFRCFSAFFSREEADSIAGPAWADFWFSALIAW